MARMTKRLGAPAPADRLAGDADLGRTIQRLRQAYSLSLGQLSEQSGVAKSIIAAIERNESNPTLNTVRRLTAALNTTIDAVLGGDGAAAVIEHGRESMIPQLISQDRKCSLRIIGWLSVVGAVQWYEFRAQPGGLLESDPHPAGSVENLSVIDGRLRVSVGGIDTELAPGETLRYRGDLPHVIANTGDGPALAFMVNLLNVPVA